MTTERRVQESFDDKIGSSLLGGAFISRQELDLAIAKAKASGKKLAEILLAEQMVTSETLSTVMSFLLKLPVVELRQFKVQPEAVNLVPESLAREKGVLPLSIEGDILKIAMEDPQDLQLIDTLAALTRKRIRPVLPLKGGLREGIDANYKSTARMAEELGRIVAPQSVQAQAPVIRRIEPDAVTQAPSVKAVDTLISQAVKDRASDIHIVPSREALKVFYRIDGFLHEVVSLPLGVHQSLTSRIKVLSGMDIAEKRRPQDGQFSATVDNKDINFRVATSDTFYGEMLVLRVLDKAMSLLQLPELGLQPAPFRTFERLLQSPFGMIMVSGPTGSGKTTTLYSALNQLAGKGRNVMTIEDPIEYQFEGINQIQVNRQAGITYAVGLRAIMRLDPDIILIGEIRDREAAEIAIQAALTGHLVLTSIHSNDAASAITRLIDMGIEPFLVTSAVIGSVAQRLVRKVCSYCKTITSVSADEALAYQKEMREVRTDFYVGRGCNFCAQTGYKGRLGVFEVMALSGNIRQLISHQAQVSEIKEAALKEGMISMRQDGMIKAKDGLTSPNEVIKSVFTID